MRYVNRGYTISFALSHEGMDYELDCTYLYDKKKEGYFVSMYLSRSDLTIKEDAGTLFFEEEKERVCRHICRDVEKLDKDGYFYETMQRIDYFCQCFDIGNMYLEEQEEEV